MPSFITFQGQTIRRPGVYGEITAESLGGSGVSTGNVAIVGEFPELEVGTPLTVSNSRSLRAVTSNAQMLQLSKLAFQPSTDQRVPAGANTLTLANVQPSTAASMTLLSLGGSASAVLTSRLRGTMGNRVFVKVTTNASDQNAVDVAISRDGDTEAFNAVGSGDLAEVWYSGAELSTTTLSTSPAIWAWMWTRAQVFAAGGGAQSVIYTPDEVLFGNQVLSVALVNGGAGASSADVTVTIVGYDETGTAKTEVKTATGGGVVFGTGGANTTNKWSAVTTVTFATADASYDGTVTLTGTAFSIDTSEFKTVGDVLALINNNSNKGFNATSLSPLNSRIPAYPDSDSDTGAGGVDTLASVNVMGSGSKATIRANLWAFTEAVDGSKIVTAKIASTLALPPKHYGASPATSEQGFLLGGSATAAGATDWDNGFNSILGKDVQIVVPFSTDVTNHAKAVLHCKAAAQVGRERSAWMGATANQTLAALLSGWTGTLNSPYAALVAQEVKLEDPAGRLRWYDPRYLAVMMAGMQGGTDVATPLTTKRPLVYDVRSNFAPELEAESALSKGLVILTSDELGWLVERSITTYMTDDNPAYSEVSSWESLQTSVRLLRGDLQSRVGVKLTGAQIKTVIGLARTNLDEQVKNGVLKAYQNISFEDMGDGLGLAYDAAPVEPLNFVVVTVNAVRISAI